MLVHIKELFKPGVVGKFAYPAFNTQNLESTMGIIQAAEDVGVPIIIETSEGAIKYAGLETLFEIMATLAKQAKVPIALHMDHGKDMALLKRGIEIGYSSIMIDHSAMPFEQNVQDTKAMVEFAHSHGAWVQAEIGRMRGSEDWISVSDSETLLTDPKEALRFYELTRVDTLACSVGTVHGLIKVNGVVEPHVDVPRIKEIHELVKIPLVLHGASVIPDSVIDQSIQSGVAIINIDTELRLAFADSLRSSLADQPNEVDVRKIMQPVIAAVADRARMKLKQFKTQNII